MPPMIRFSIIFLAATSAFSASAQSKSEPIAATPDELVDAYRANPIAAKRQYSGKSVLLSGKVAGIEEGKSGSAVVSFGGAWEGYIVDVITTEDVAVKLRLGQNVTFQCGSVRRGTPRRQDVLLESCRIR